MTPEEFNQAITKLAAGDISELVVEKPDFFVFREVWLTHPDKKRIIGEARLGGRVIYTQVKDEL